MKGPGVLRADKKIWFPDRHFQGMVLKMHACVSLWEHFQGSVCGDTPQTLCASTSSFSYEGLGLKSWEPHTIWGTELGANMNGSRPAPGACPAQWGWQPQVQIGMAHGRAPGALWRPAVGSGSSGHHGREKPGLAHTHKSAKQSLQGARTQVRGTA